MRKEQKGTEQEDVTIAHDCDVFASASWLLSGQTKTEGARTAVKSPR